MTRDALEAHVIANPDDAEAHRELGIVYAQEHQFPLASEHLERAQQLRADDPRTLYHRGLVSEVLRQEVLAMQLYERYADVPRTSPYRERLFGRYNRLLRRQLRTELRAALAQEDELTAGPLGDAVAVLPFTFRGGDPQFEPLGRGLAEMISADLANFEQLTLVERVRTQVLLAEVELARDGHVDLHSAPRLGRLIRAGRFVGGQYSAAERNLRVESSVVEAADAGLPQVSAAEGRVERLFEVQKEVVAGVLASLGVELDSDQRARLAAIPTYSLAAFLSFSRGLQAEDGDDLELASRYFREALRQDPSFTMAADRAALVEAMQREMVDPTRLLSASASGMPGSVAVPGLAAPRPPVLGFLRPLIPRRSARAAPKRDDDQVDHAQESIEGHPAAPASATPLEPDLGEPPAAVAAVVVEGADVPEAPPGAAAAIESEQADVPEPAETPQEAVAALEAQDEDVVEQTIDLPPEGVAAAEAEEAGAPAPPDEQAVSELRDDVGMPVQPAPPPVANVTSSAGLPAGTALAVGYSHIALDYASGQRAYPYSFRGPARTFMLYGRYSSLRLAFGRQEAVVLGTSAAPAETQLHATSLVELALASGGDIAVFRSAQSVPLELFVPIRLNLTYRALSSDERGDNDAAVGGTHLPGASLGTGLGTWARFPTSISGLDDRLVALGSLTFTYGAMTEIASDFDAKQTRATRGLSFDLELRLERLIANSAGISIGYTHVSASWSDDYINRLSETGLAARWEDRLSRLSSSSSQHFLRIGINW